MLKKADLESLSLISDLKNKLNEIDLKSITLIGICGAAAYYLYNINKNIPKNKKNDQKKKYQNEQKKSSKNIDDILKNNQKQQIQQPLKEQKKQSTENSKNQHQNSRKRSPKNQIIEDQSQISNKFSEDDIVQLDPPPKLNKKFKQQQKFQTDVDSDYSTKNTPRLNLQRELDLKNQQGQDRLFFQLASRLAESDAK